SVHITILTRLKHDSNRGTFHTMIYEKVYRVYIAPSLHLYYKNVKGKLDTIIMSNYV
ncbi:4746_t:CDS:2, partial [Gigaspora rosea]